MLRLVFKPMSIITTLGCIAGFVIMHCATGCSKKDTIPTKDQYKEVLEKICQMPGGPELDIMKEVGRSAKKQRPVIDQVAAEIILQDYLETLRR